MRRYVAFRAARQGLVAIYDALLFLMVVILISEGMFLYTATTTGRNGEFSDDHYQHLADTGRIMVEALSLNESYPMPMIEWSNSTDNETRPLDHWVAPSEADTVRWLLGAFVELTWKNEAENGTYDTGTIMPIVNAIFAENRLAGTDHAWLFLYLGEVELFGSNAVGSVEDLPEDRWASSSDYTLVVNAPKAILYEAELRYFIWLQ